MIPQLSDASGQRMRSALLLLGLLMLIVTAFLVPAAPGSAAAQGMAVLYLAVFSVASYLIGARRKWLVAYLALAACIWIAGIAQAALPGTHHRLEIARTSLFSLLQLMLVWLVVRFSMFDPHASRPDRIVAGISGYLIIGFMWASLYALNEVIRPGGLVDSSDQALPGNDGELLYYSLVTLTTTGYGDFVPVSPSARLLASLESVAGTLYLAVFIAALLGKSETTAQVEAGTPSE